MRYLALIPSLILLSLIFHVTLAEEVTATTGLSKSIGIALSKTCETIERNNITGSNCPTTEWLISLGLDTTNEIVSGELVQHEDGYWYREKPNLVNHYRFYDYDSFNIFIDPHGDMRDRTKMIFIESSLPEYKIRGESFTMENNTRVTYKERYVDDRCRNATLGSENILSTLPDTIRYLRSDCDPTHTTMQTTINNIQEKTEFDITTSQKWKDDQERKWIIENCLKEYGKCN